MKRRHFLSLVGASAAVPALPALSANALPAKLKAMGMAHAQKYPMVSALGISRRMKIPREQAQQILSYLFEKGAIGQAGVQGTGITSAASRVFRPVPYQASASSFSNKPTKPKTVASEKVSTPVEDQTDWLTHLQVVCVKNGFDLSPRALAAVAA